MVSAECVGYGAREPGRTDDLMCRPLLIALSAALTLGVLAAPPALAQEDTGPLRIEITEGVVEPMPIAVVPFFDEGGAGTLAADIQRVVTADLTGTDLFREIPEDAQVARPEGFEALVAYPDWRAINAEALILGAVAVQGDDVTDAQTSRLAGVEGVAGDAAVETTMVRVTGAGERRVFGLDDRRHASELGVDGAQPRELALGGGLEVARAPDDPRRPGRACFDVSHVTLPRSTLAAGADTVPRRPHPDERAYLTDWSRERGPAVRESVPSRFRARRGVHDPRRDRRPRPQRRRRPGRCSRGSRGGGRRGPLS